MWRLRTTIVTGVVLLAIVMGATVAYGVWWWNSNVEVNGSELRTVWEVLDDDICAYCYSANVLIKVPKDADAHIVDTNTNETVRIRKAKSQSCLSDGTEVHVQATVSDDGGGTGTQAKVTLIVDGTVVSEKVGAIGSKIKQDIVMPSTCP